MRVAANLPGKPDAEVPATRLKHVYTCIFHPKLN